VAKIPGWCGFDESRLPPEGAIARFGLLRFCHAHTMGAVGDLTTRSIAPILDAARAAYEACWAKYPKRLLFLCQGGRTLRWSDRDEPEVRTL